jgi:hypothetical protein
MNKITKYDFTAILIVAFIVCGVLTIMFASGVLK